MLQIRFLNEITVFALSSHLRSSATSLPWLRLNYICRLLPFLLDGKPDFKKEQKRQLLARQILQLHSYNNLLFRMPLVIGLFC